MEKSLGPIDNESGKLYLYRKIKSNFQYEKYLNDIKKFKYRRAMTALRISAHRLEIETGRYTINGGNFVSRKDRLCKLCLQDDIKVMGDELHAIMICPSFNKGRGVMLNTITNACPNFSKLSISDQLIFLLTAEDEYAINISKFIHEVLSAPRQYGYKKVKKISTKNSKK